MAKKLIVGVVSLLVLAGGATAAMKFLNIGPFAQLPLQDGMASEKKKKVPIFIDMEPLILTLMEDDKISKPLQIQITLETYGQDNATFLEQRIIKLKAEFFKDLYSFIPRLLKEKNRLDVPILNERLKIVGTRLIGKNYIAGVQANIKNNKNKR